MPKFNLNINECHWCGHSVEEETDICPKCGQDQTQMPVEEEDIYDSVNMDHE